MKINTLNPFYIVCQNFEEYQRDAVEKGIKKYLSSQLNIWELSDKLKELGFTHGKLTAQNQDIVLDNLCAYIYKKTTNIDDYYKILQNMNLSQKDITLHSQRFNFAMASSPFFADCEETKEV